MLGFVGQFAIRWRFRHLTAATGGGPYKKCSLPTKPGARLQEVFHIRHDHSP